MRTTAFVVVLCLTVAGCATRMATTVDLPRERRTECEAFCAKLDLRLAAVVIVRDSAGCVCETVDAERAAMSGGGATIAGAAAIVADEEAQKERQHPPHQQHHGASHGTTVGY